MKTHSINLKPYQITAASEGRLGLVCVPMRNDDGRRYGYKETHRHTMDIIDGSMIMQVENYSPYAQGDVLVCREAFLADPPDNGKWDFALFTDGEIYNYEVIPHRYRNSQHVLYDQSKHDFELEPASKMPDWAIRFRWTITDVEPLWLPEISEEDAVRCGVRDNSLLKAPLIFQNMWQAQHKREWEQWVWALSLEAKE